MSLQTSTELLTYHIAFHIKENSLYNGTKRTTCAQCQTAILLYDNSVVMTSKQQSNASWESGEGGQTNMAA